VAAPITAHIAPTDVIHNEDQQVRFLADSLLESGKLSLRRLFPFRMQEAWFTVDRVDVEHLRDDLFASFRRYNSTIMPNFSQAHNPSIMWVIVCSRSDK
jgi:hypothetical protein